MTLRTKLIVFAAAAAFAFATLNAGSAASGTTWIVFAASPAHATEPDQLFGVRASGGSLRQMTTGTRPAGDPAFAPDGRRVAFARLGSGLFVVNLDASDLHRLTGSGSDRYPVWSPNGRLIAFVRETQSSYRLWVMNADGRRQHRLRLAPPMGAAERPGWTPDGKSLVIPATGSFYMVSAATGKILKRLTPTWDVTLGQLLWTLSPNGRTIAYVGRRPEPAGCQRAACEVFALYLQGVSATHARRVMNDAGVAGWSRDGRRLVYAHGGAIDVQPLRAGTAKVIPVGDLGLSADSPPAWQPR